MNLEMFRGVLKASSSPSRRSSCAWGAEAELTERDAQMTVLGDTHVDIEQYIGRLNTQRENITRDMAQVISLEAELE